MNIIDICILIALGLGFIVGFKRGFTRELVSLVGIFVIIVLSFLFKNPISIFLYNHLPFINFGGLFKDLTVINILFYEIVAFAIVFFVLQILFRLLTRITSIFEKLLNMTIILGIPSKILGGILGVVQTFIYIFLAVYILNLPMVGTDLIKESKVGNDILNKTPILSNICDSTLNVINEIIDLKDEYNKTNNTDEFNQKTLNIMIDNNVITKENAQHLIDIGKIKGVTIE